MSKILDIILISTISFGSGWIFGPQIVHWASRKIDETIPEVKRKIDEAKESKGKDMENKDLKIPEENVITVQDFGHNAGDIGYWTFDIKNKLNLPTPLVSINGKWMIGKGHNEFLNNYLVLNKYELNSPKEQNFIYIPETFKINIVKGSDFFLKTNKELDDTWRYIINGPNSFNEKSFLDNKEIQEMIKNNEFISSERDLKRLQEIINPNKQIL